MVLRLLVSAAVVVAASGCKESLFDSTIGGGEDDASVSPGIDGAPGGIDGGPGGPDASQSGPACPEACRGDAVRDYDGTQGGTNGRWKYRDDPRDRTWSDLTAGTYNGMTALVGGGTPAAAIVDCRAYPGEAECAGDPTALLIVATASGGARDPALEFTVPATGAYQVTGDLTPAADGDMHRLKIYRNTREDLLAVAAVPGDTTTVPFSVDVEAVEGDRLLLVVEPATGSTARAFRLHMFVSEQIDAFPRACGVTVRFEDTDMASITDDCNQPYTARVGDGGSGYMDLTAPTYVASVIPELGQGVRLALDQYLLPGSAPMNYSGDFTIQMWAQLSDYSWTYATMYADWNSDVPGGVYVDYDYDDTADTVTISAYVLRPPSGDSTGISFTWPSDEQWHHLRLVRNTTTGTWRACVDGQQAASTGLSGALELSSDTAPFLGRNVTYNPPYFAGAIDDVRVFSRAYPCGM